MNASQQKSVEWVKRQIETWHGTCAESYEIKRFEVTEHALSFRKDPMVFISAVVGLKGDEGTMAAVMCRDTWHLHIGPRGSVTNVDKTIKGAGRMAIINGRRD